MNAELPPIKNGEQFSECASTLDHDIVPLNCFSPYWLFPAVSLGGGYAGGYDGYGYPAAPAPAYGYEEYADPYAYSAAGGYPGYESAAAGW